MKILNSRIARRRTAFLQVRGVAKRIDLSSDLVANRRLVEQGRGLFCENNSRKFNREIFARGIFEPIIELC